MTQKQRLWKLANNWHKVSHKTRTRVNFDDYFRAVFYLLPSPAKCTDNCLALGIKHIKDTLGNVGDQLLNAAFDHIDRRRYNEFGRELFKCDRIEELVILVQKYVDGSEKLQDKPKTSIKSRMYYNGKNEAMIREKFNTFIDNALDNKQHNETLKIIKKSKEFVYTANEIRHTSDEHGDAGKEALKNQLPVTADILKMLVDIVFNEDEYAKKYNEMKNSTKFHKRINGYIVIVELNKTNGGYIYKTTYIKNRKPAVNTLNDCSPRCTSENDFQLPASYYNNEQNENLLQEELMNTRNKQSKKTYKYWWDNPEVSVTERYKEMYGVRINKVYKHPSYYLAMEKLLGIQQEMGEKRDKCAKKLDGFLDTVKKAYISRKRNSYFTVREEINLVSDGELELVVTGYEDGLFFMKVKYTSVTAMEDRESFVSKDIKEIYEKILEQQTRAYWG